MMTVNKRIGIITSYFAANYGAMLQPFALKRVLEKMGCDVEVLRYRQQDIWDAYNPLSLRKLFQKSVTASLAAFLFLPWALKKEHRFRRFMHRFINPDPGFDDKIKDDKDCYFIGSDQLWRTFGSDEHFDPVYMGYFETRAGARKISYAVSGEHLELNAENKRYLQQAFRNFDMISVREQKRADDFSPLAEGKKIEVVLDPTLLATSDLYEELPHENPMPEHPFIVFYCVRHSQHFVHKVYEYARRQNCHLLIFSEGFKPSLILMAMKHSEVHYYMTAGEEAFLGAMRYAKAVFTASFHGAAFAVINHRSLYSLMLDDGHDTRPKELLLALGMGSRLLYLDKTIDESPIDYDKAENLLSALRQKSMQFIDKALND